MNALVEESDTAAYDKDHEDREGGSSEFCDQNTDQSTIDSIDNTTSLLELDRVIKEDVYYVSAKFLDFIENIINGADSLLSKVSTSFKVLLVLCFVLLKCSDTSVDGVGGLFDEGLLGSHFELEDSGCSGFITNWTEIL